MIDTQEHWKQFSLYPKGCRNQFYPKQVLYQFLPDFIAANLTIVEWHILFEPSALIRVRAENHEIVILSAMRFAALAGLEFSLGDCSSDWNSNLLWPGEDYYGEEAIYGRELWNANKRFMHANSLLSLELVKLPPLRREWAYRKMAHLLCNSFGMTVPEEVAFSLEFTDNRREVLRKYGNI